MFVRKEEAEFTRCCDVLLHGVSRELTYSELALLQAYTERMQDTLRVIAPVSSDSTRHLRT